MDDEHGNLCADPGDTEPDMSDTTSDIAYTIRLRGKEIEFDGYLVGEIDARLSQLATRCSSYPRVRAALAACEYACHQVALTYATEINAHRSTE